MRRTAAVDTELAGTPIACGDKVVMWYVSANYDDAHFADPFQFDIGGPTTSTCRSGVVARTSASGAFLARMEIRVLLEEMARRGITVEQTGPEVRVASNFVHGVASVPMTVVR
jgi:cytochrome P450